MCHTSFFIWYLCNYSHQDLKERHVLVILKMYSLFSTTLIITWCQEWTDFYDHDESTSSSKVSAPTQAASSETPPSQAANSEIQDGPIRPYYTRSGREVRPPRRFQDYTK